MKKSLGLPKLTRPSSANVLLRPRLLERLHAEQRLIWISAPAGSGKTTLVSSYIAEFQPLCLWYSIDAGDNDPAGFFHYLGLAAKQASPHHRKPLPALTPEYLPGLAVFTLRYFENLYRRLKRPAVLVFDNYQEASAASPLQEILRIACETLPEEVRIIAISREDPPASLARTRAHGALTLLDWDDLQLTLEESLLLGKLRGVDASAPDSGARIEALHRYCQGWAAGMTLLFEQGHCTESVPALSATGKEVLFDYFARELFGRTPPQMRALLLKTAFLTHIDSKTAAQLTGNTRAESLLAELYRKNYFLSRREYPELVYEFHPLFRNFLLAMADQSLGPEATRQLRLETAALLEQTGTIDQAGELYCAAEDWPSLERLIMTHAQSFISQGRNQTLEQWLAWLPDFGMNAWLYYWKGVCRLAFDLIAARGFFEKAFSLFESSNDVAGLYLSWAGVVQTYIFEWRNFKPLDYWIEAIERILAQHPEFPSSEIEMLVHSMLVSIHYRQPHHSMLPVWSKRALQLLQSCFDPALIMQLGFSLMMYSMWQGELHITHQVMEAIRRLRWDSESSPLVHTQWSMTAAFHAWSIGDHRSCLDYVADGLQIAAATGVHINDALLSAQGIYGCLVAGDLRKAEDFLRSLALATPSLDFLQGAHYYFIAAQIEQQRGDFAKALEHALVSLHMATDAGTPFPQAASHNVAALSLFELGEKRRGAEHLREARAIGISIGNNTVEYLCRITEARIASERDKILIDRSSLRKAITLSREIGCDAIGWWDPETMGRLYAEALEGDIETDYVQTLIEKRGLLPPTSCSIPESWPLPIKIYTLGRFEVIKGDEPLVFSSKTPKKPLELLQCLIAFGGTDIPSEALYDKLWPDADGDAAQRVLVTTLHRLRQLLGCQEAIGLAGGNLSLNPRAVWLDAWAFEGYLKKLEENRKHGNEDEVKRLRQKVLDLYRGPFLPNWNCRRAVQQREQMRAYFLHHILAAGDALESDGRLEEAAACYLAALNADEHEHLKPLYDRLTRCHGSRTHAGEAGNSKSLN